MKKKPTIEELERALDGKEGGSPEILPSGEIKWRDCPACKEHIELLKEVERTLVARDRADGTPEISDFLLFKVRTGLGIKEKNEHS